LIPDQDLFFSGFPRCQQSSKTTSYEEDLKVKTVEIKVFLDFFLIVGRFPGSVQIITDPDPGGQKTYGTSRSGTQLLLVSY
jgi:hypothetical protein